MSDEIARVRERMLQLRRAQTAMRTTGDVAQRDPARGGTVSFVPGDRVFDTRTGEEGVVAHAYRETIIGHTPER